MEQIKMYKNSEKYGFKKDDVFTVLRNIMNECVIIMADKQMPNLILQESTAKKIRNHHKNVAISPVLTINVFHDIMNI